MEQSSSNTAALTTNHEVNDTTAAATATEAPSPSTIAATITILVIGSNSGISCGKPLQLYLIIFVARVGLSLPLSIYQHLFTPRNQRRNNRRVRRRGSRRRRRRHNESRQDTSTVPATTEATGSSATDISPQNDNHSQQEIGNNQHAEDEAHHNQGRPASLISGWTDRVKSLLDLFAILWFIVGNYLIFSPSDCPTTAAPYYYTILTWVLVGYLILLIPLLACGAVIFCLPCVLVALRTFSINVTNVMVGGTKEEIAEIPVFKYKASTHADTTEDTTTPHTSENSNDTTTNRTTFTTTTTKKPNFIRRIMKRPSYHNHPDQQKQHAHLDTITIPRAEDAVCSICLGEYETDELICKLWQVFFFCAMCQHHYHKDCVQEWLALNSKCPLCKRDFRGKDYVGDSDESDTDDDEEEQY
ncbi:hypothetical protein HMPREF1544_03781 [Mucor circinelloides 1006PhL]|uniref:RING-type domain-containing protein n=1 Tax=Mucor circinelloides f. circinelloides (strain 1006PhL) TaxID=1220926 RepID=S2JLR1_MUCC1|nr:hypothetical protein HMPREF1544_03781 [Mucor circinelloides 1006PhL]